jgi:hypothetical protein
MTNVDEHIKYYKGEKPPLQKSISIAGRVYLNLVKDDFPENQEIQKDLIRNFQKNIFGRKNSDHCSLELLPLPNKKSNDKDWLYKDINIDFLKTRKDYENYLLPKRILLFKELINKHNPEIIIFYGLGYLSSWEQISEVTFKRNDDNKNLLFAKNGNKKFFVLPHPSTRGLTNNDWNKMGETIKSIAK